MLLVGIVLLLSIVVSAMAFGLSVPADRAPTATFEMTPGECNHELRHTTGEPIDGNRTKLTGVEDPEALAGRTLTAGDTLTLNPTADEVKLVWDSGDRVGSSVVERFDVDPDATGGCTVILYTATAGSIDSVGGDDAPVKTLSATSDAKALGPADGDLTGDGTADTPFVEGGDTIALTNATNETTTVADSSDINGSIAGSKTRLAVGSWNDSPESVFFVDENHDTLYRVTPSGSPVEVATPGNGTQAVSGTGDVDDDGGDEVVYVGLADGNLRYIDDIYGGSDVVYLHDDNGDRIAGSAETGAV